MSRIPVVVGGGVLAVLVGVGVFALGPSALFGLAVFGVLTGTSAVALAFATSTGDIPDAEAAARNRGLAVGVATVLGLAALMGLGALFGEALGPILALLAAVAAIVLGLRWLSTYGSGPPLPDAAKLTDDELCQQWLRSYAVLRRASDARSAERVAGARQRYLDEFERRDPAGFAPWLAEEAGPDSAPARFLAGESDDAGGPVGIADR